MRATRLLVSSTVLVAGLKLAAATAVRRYERLPLQQTEPSGSLANLQGLRIHYLDAGSGQPLVLLHGLGASTFSFRRNIGQLSRTFRVIVPDRPGHGLSSRSVRDLSLDAQARCLAGLLDHLGLGRVSIAGHSMGGSVALRFAATRPERVERLVLIASTTDEYMKRAASFSPLLAAFVPLFVSLVLHTRRGRHLWMGRLVGSTSYLSPDIEAGYGAPGHIVGTVAGYQRLLLDRRRDASIDLAQIEAPTLIIWGDRDRLVSIENGRRLANAIPNSRMVVLPGAGHLVQEEQSEAVNGLIEEFVAQRSEETTGAGRRGAS